MPTADKSSVDGAASERRPSPDTCKPQAAPRTSAHPASRMHLQPIALLGLVLLGGAIGVHFQ